MSLRNNVLISLIIVKLPVYAIVRCVFRTLAWLFSLFILHIERTKAMPTAQSRGHGLGILIFWCLATIIELLALISYRSPYWFYQHIFNSDSPIEEIEIVRFGYWCFRVSASMIVFFIGLRAPGVPRRRYAIMLNHMNAQGEQEQRRQNVWRKFFQHFRMLAPFIWPRGHFGLQLNILVCIGILLIGRILALEIPRYTKLISKRIIFEYSNKILSFIFPLADELIESSNKTTDTLFDLGAKLRSPETWPWRLVTILMVLRFLQGEIDLLSFNSIQILTMKMNYLKI